MAIRDSGIRHCQRTAVVLGKLGPGVQREQIFLTSKLGLRLREAFFFFRTTLRIIRAKQRTHSTLVTLADRIRCEGRLSFGCQACNTAVAVRHAVLSGHLPTTPEYMSNTDVEGS